MKAPLASTPPNRESVMGGSHVEQRRRRSPSVAWKISNGPSKGLLSRKPKSKYTLCCHVPNVAFRTGAHSQQTSGSIAPSAEHSASHHATIPEADQPSVAIFSEREECKATTALRPADALRLAWLQPYHTCQKCGIFGVLPKTLRSVTDA